MRVRVATPINLSDLAALAVVDEQGATIWVDDTLAPAERDAAVQRLRTSALIRRPAQASDRAFLLVLHRMNLAGGTANGARSGASVEEVTVDDGVDSAASAGAASPAGDAGMG